MQYMLSFCIVIASAVIVLSWSIDLEWNGMEWNRIEEKRREGQKIDDVPVLDTHLLALPPCTTCKLQIQV